MRDAHKERISAIAVTPDNRFIVSGSGDHSIKVLSIADNQFEDHFENAHEGRITSLAISSNSCVIVSASEDNSIKIFDRITHKEIYHFNLLSAKRSP